MFFCDLLWQRAAPLGLICATKAPKEVSIILSKEAHCFGVFWFGKGPPLGLIYATKAPKISRILSKEARCFGVFGLAKNRPLKR